MLRSETETQRFSSCGSSRFSPCFAKKKRQLIAQLTGALDAERAPVIGWIQPFIDGGARKRNADPFASVRSVTCSGPNIFWISHVYRAAVVVIGHSAPSTPRHKARFASISDLVLRTLSRSKLSRLEKVPAARAAPCAVRRIVIVLQKLGAHRAVRQRFSSLQISTPPRPPLSARDDPGARVRPTTQQCRAVCLPSDSRSLRHG